MAYSSEAVTEITRILDEQDRSFAWLARRIGVPYKRVLAEVKHQTRPVALDTALLAADALGIELPRIVGTEKSAA